MKALQIFLFQLLSIVFSAQAQTEVSFKLANIFGDNKVLQQGIDVPVWRGFPRFPLERITG